MILKFIYRPKYNIARDSEVWRGVVSLLPGGGGVYINDFYIEGEYREIRKENWGHGACSMCFKFDLALKIY